MKFLKITRSFEYRCGVYKKIASFYLWIINILNAKKYNQFIIEDGLYHLLNKKTLPAVASFAPGDSMVFQVIALSLLGLN